MEKVTTEEIGLLLKMIAKGLKIPKIIHDVVLDVAQREIVDKERVVVYKRDPNIHSRRIQGAYVKIIDSTSIEINPLACAGFGADFDGDTMSVYAPLSQEAQNQVKDKMITAYSSTGMNRATFEIQKDIIVGIFTLTYEQNKGQVKVLKTIEEASSLHIGQMVEVKFKGKMVKTTAGRIVFNSNLPEWYPFVDLPINKKEINKILETCIKKTENDYVQTIAKMQKIGFFYSTIYPKTISLDLMDISPELEELKRKLSKEKDLSRQSDIVLEMENKLIEYLKSINSDIYHMVESGGSKGRNQIRQLMVAKGLISDADGNILPPLVKSINEGFEPEEYFQAAAGARKGSADRALNTAYGGYAYRKAIFAVGDVTLDPNNRNCGTKRTMDIKLTPELFGRMTGRYVIDKNDVYPISKDMVGQIVKLRTPIFCKTRNLCTTCYGELYKQLRTHNVGITCAQEVASLSEKIMKSFHLGGAVILDRVNIQKELMDSLNDEMEPTLKRLTEQVENDLIALSEFAMIRIDKTIYASKENEIKYHDTFISIPVGHFVLTLDNLEIKAGIEKPTKIYITDQKEEDERYLTFMYNKKDKLIKVEPIQEDFSNLARQLDGLVAGKSPWGDIPGLYKKFYKTMSGSGSWDSVHLEVLISNSLRAAKDPQKPARLVEPFEPTMVSIKDIPYLTSWPLGLGFEDFKKSLGYGLTSDRGVTSPIEKIMLGESLVEEK